MSLNKRLFTGGQLPGATLENAFSAYIYDGNGSSQSLTGLGFKPDLLWIKQRGGDNPHLLMDSSRGAGILLTPNTTANESGNSGNFVGSFDNDGFQVNRNYLSYTAHDTTNYGVGDAAKYVAWAWRANEGTTSSNSDGNIASTVQVNSAAGFSIVQFTGSGSNTTVGHGLGAAPDFILMTNRTRNGYGWYVYNSASGPTKNMVLNTRDGLATNAAAWNNTATTATTFSLGTETGTNSNNYPYIAYCWHSVPGYSKFGTYTGTGSSGHTIDVGFQPGFVIVRSTASSEDWLMFDSARGNNKVIYANSNAEEATYNTFGLTSTGFELPQWGSSNGNGQTYIYAAWREAT